MTLGVLGGLGPMSSVYFYEMLTSLTRATRDQEHLDIIISSRATTPDRTDFILGRSKDDPSDVMIEEAKKLVLCGAEVIAIPCNTAHYFYDRISDSISVPVLNIIYQTCERVLKEGGHTLGILATEGTVKSGAYKVMCDRLGLGYIAPDEEEQAVISHIIYNCIKSGEDADMASLMRVADSLTERGADRIVLGCTELSLLTREHSFDCRFIDSLETLARCAIRYCGKETIN